MDVGVTWSAVAKAARPWELVPPIEEMIVPNMITTSTSHPMPSAAR